MAQLLTRRQMLAATGISGSIFDRMINRQGMALTFGVVRAPVANRYIATDPVFARVVIDLSATSRLSQPLIATLVRLDNFTVLETIVGAERESSLVLAFIKGANAVQLLAEPTPDCAITYGDPRRLADCNVRSVSSRLSQSISGS